MPTCSARPYAPRQTPVCDAVRIVRQHLPGFVERAEQADAALPRFVTDELEGLLRCGDFEHGFLRLRCSRCAEELRVPFSCKARGTCPSCMGRRMCEGAASWVDHLLPAVPYRQWVLSFSSPLCVRLGYDASLLAAVNRSFARRLMQHLRRRVKAELGLPALSRLHGGVLTVAQRFRADLGLYVHLHCLALDGVYEQHRGRQRPVSPACRPS